MTENGADGVAHDHRDPQAELESSVDEPPTHTVEVIEQSSVGRISAPEPTVEPIYSSFNYWNMTPDISAVSRVVGEGRGSFPGHRG